MNKPVSLFVYGSLQPGRSNARVLESIGGSWTRASVRGHLKPKGWGAKLGYAALVLDAHGDKVEGFVFTSENLAPHLHALDEFEGSEYKRALTAVTLEDGSEPQAYIYVLNESEQR